MKPFLELGQFVGPVLSIAAVVILLVGCVIYVHGRDWIRARFKRNMPSGYQRPEVPVTPPAPAAQWKWLMRGEQAETNEAFLARMRREGRYPPPPTMAPDCTEVREIPAAGPIAAGDPISIGPDGAAVSEIGESLRVASKMFSRGICRGRRVTVDGEPRYLCEKGIGPWLGMCADGTECPSCRRVVTAIDVPEETEQEKEAKRAEIEAANRAYKITLMAERLFVQHRGDPEQAYADAARWVDSRVAAALAEGRDPGELPEEPLADAFDPINTYGFGLLPRITLRCPEHAEDFPPVEKCPACAERNARMSREPIIATVNEFHWRIDPEAEIPTARGGEDGSLVRFNGEAFEFEMPASYVYPPDLPVAVADALRVAWSAKEFLTTYGREPALPMGAASDSPTAAFRVELDPDPKSPDFMSAGRFISESVPRGPDIDRLLALPTNGDEFDAHRLLEMAEERDPELAARIDARKANDHLRRAASLGRVDLARPGKRGAGGRMPTYRLAAAVAEPPRQGIEPPDLGIPVRREEVEQVMSRGAERPSEVTPPEPRRPQARCMVHGVDLVSEDDLCYLCMGRAKR